MKTKLWAILALSCVFSCADVYTPRTYEINNEEVTCSHREFTDCGVNLWGCDNGKDYYCVLTVIEI